MSGDGWMNGLDWQPIPGEPPEKQDNLPIATHEAVLEVMGKKLRCYQLDNGQRIIHADDVAAFFSDALGSR